MHVSFSSLCLTSHDLVKLKTFPFGPQWLSLGGYAFSRSSWMVEHVGGWFGPGKGKPVWRYQAGLSGTGRGRDGALWEM